MRGNEFADEAAKSATEYSNTEIYSNKVTTTEGFDTYIKGILMNQWIVKFNNI